HDVKSTDQLVREVGGLMAGETATFRVIRGGKEMNITVKIEERSDKIAADNTNLWPGFVAMPLTSELRTKYEIDKKVKGIIVGSVFEKSPAAALRLRAGDIITAVNDKKVGNVKEFYEAMSTAGNEVWFDIYSDGHTVSTNHYKLNK
ncbi:MAG: PDZ domain-containing protein, partial [Spirochaetaceae bacterium]|nr:PDZ domain-containing protein [Spirochaetaceae bacterium]